MNDETAFLKAIKNGDDTAAVVYADWLDDHERPADAELFRHGIVKRFGTDFNSPGGALTLSAGEVCDNGAETGNHVRTHPDGWTISGEVHEDYFVWVNDFVATHPTFGRVEGNFESFVAATSEEAFADFYAKHPPNAWDYYDI